MFTLVVKKDKRDLCMLLDCKKIKFLSPQDEVNFFSWAENLCCINQVYGEGFSIIIETKDTVDDNCLRELIAVFYRYNIKMTQLKVFLNKDNKFWFYSNTKSCWHRKVFRNRK